MIKRPQLEGKVILIVDDNEIICSAMSRVCKILGMVCATDPSARHALKTVEYTKFDVILTDYRMPDMNGIEFYLELQKICGNDMPPVIFMTGSHVEDIQKELVDSPVKPAAYITKPFILDEVSKIFEDVILNK